MKPGPVLAMVALLFVGMWLVLQPTLRRGNSDIAVRVGSMEILLVRQQRVDTDGPADYRVIAPAELVGEVIEHDRLDDFLALRLDAWLERPAWERALLGVFNISRWSTFGWVVIGLIGQGAFFGRMMIQWIISERSRVSTVPEVFWWLSLAGGLCLFVYFVWRKDIVGVLGQASGVVIYARNLRLIQKRHAEQAATAAA